MIIELIHVEFCWLYDQTQQVGPRRAIYTVSVVPSRRVVLCAVMSFETNIRPTSHRAQSVARIHDSLDFDVGYLDVRVPNHH